MFRFIWEWRYKRKSAYERIRQITVFRVSRDPKQWTGTFQGSNTCTNLWNNMMEENAGSSFQERIWKEWACLHSGGSSWVSDFSARQVFKGGGPDSENSKLVKAPTVPKLTSRNPGHATGAHWHRYIKLWEKRISSINFLMEQISDFRLSTKLSKIYHHQKDIIKQETIKSCWEFDLMTHFGQSWPVLGIAATGSR